MILFVQKFKKKLDKAKDDARSNIARWSNNDRFEVTHVQNQVCC